MPERRNYETIEEYDARQADLARKRKMVTTLRINNIRVEDVGLVLEALESIGLDVEINV